MAKTSEQESRHSVRFIESFPPINDQKSGHFYSNFSQTGDSIKLNITKKPAGSKYDKIKVQETKTTSKLPDLKLMQPQKKLDTQRELVSAALIDSNEEINKKPKTSLYSYDLTSYASPRKDTVPTLSTE